MALKLQRPLPDGSLKIAARGEKKDGKAFAVLKQREFVDKIADTLNSFTPANWIAIAAIFVAILLWSSTQYLTARRERLKAYEPTPLIKATINRKSYPDGWRSVQLHIAPGPDSQLFKYENWRIERAKFLRPKDAIMARAENDDYASEVFYPENPIHTLQGKREGRPQRFALEFFMKFPGNDLGRRAQFKVSFAHVNERRRHSTKVWATVPENAELREATA